MSAPSLDTLHALLDAGLAHGPEYGDGLSSHLPMALHALHALGAGPARLQAFSTAYAHRLNGRGGAGPAPRPLPASWLDARGDVGAYEALRRHFESMLLEGGRDSTLRALLPALWPGAAGAAFHGLIRTAHAVQAAHARELAAALAYWAARWQPVPVAGAPPAGAPMPVADWAARLEAAALELRLPGRLISLRIDAAVKTPAYAALAGATMLDGLQPLSDWAADLYARSANFTVLHLVTATRAARVLWPWTTARSEVLQGLLRAATAAVLASHLQRVPAAPDETLPAWPDLVAGAIASDDEHVIKLVHALVEERAVYGEGRRQQAAAQALR
jgi:hypothetical protein